jgi:hypothetical protein
MNCLTYTIHKIIAERRAGRRGGYIIMRRSAAAKVLGITSIYHPLYWVPHFLHRDQDGKVTQYTPTETDQQKFVEYGPLRAWLRLWRFEGVVTGDDNADEYKEAA